MGCMMEWEGWKVSTDNTMVSSCNAVVMMRSSCVPHSFTQRSELSLQSRTDRCSSAGSSVVSRHITWQFSHSDQSLLPTVLHSNSRQALLCSSGPPWCSPVHASHAGHCPCMQVSTTFNTHPHRSRFSSGCSLLAVSPQQLERQTMLALIASLALCFRLGCQPPWLWLLP
jgi:hypothetical protein